MTCVLELSHREKFTPIGQELRTWAEQAGGRGKFSRYVKQRAWSPSINLYEHAEHYCVVADLSGMNPEAIDLSVENGMLVLSGSRSMPQSSARQSDAQTGPKAPDDVVAVHLMEIDYGPFRRDVKMPDDADIGRIEASYRAGYLWVIIPKK